MPKKSEIIKAVLYTIGAVGVIAVALAIPNLASAFGQIYKPARHLNHRQVTKSLNYLKRRKFIGIGREGDNTVIHLTETGKKKLLKFKLEDIKLARPKKWDGKWRVVVFDIPEKFAVRRHAFQRKLKEIGFIQLQKSVWLWPFECRNEIDFIKELYEIRPFVRIAVAEGIEGDDVLVKKFNLRR